MKFETVEEFLKRGGKIQYGETRKAIGTDPKRTNASAHMNTKKETHEWWSDKDVIPTGKFIVSGKYGAEVFDSFGDAQNFGHSARYGANRKRKTNAQTGITAQN